VSDASEPGAAASVVQVVQVVQRFNAAFGAHDVDAVMALMSPDCVFEGTSPPDGQRVEGADAVRAVWTEFFAGSPSARFDAEEVVALGDRVAVRWCYTWTTSDGGPEHVRGVDLFRIEGGLVAEKLSYVKG
jgi:uncharacterized protein (TIGR02246 family)